ncbi:Uncharacterized membrane protein HdeD, DUF308 family [Flavobacterium sp. CF108]|uniref:eCIS core domain-containing protein n=1 Tax=unclassified Flavobacterium TaxID=196869 RepID=UPI0008D8A3C7|nr:MULTISPECIES: GH-E family nuclease [unclassified Flavobacterium]SEP23160.1 Uncharacterized membrane protein HdeD, DUF308 family [Flavobacterium sp. fv08]SHI00533.1 Uncharacterized membrane protein HdeD, DUF308 family [Flavobacterium sp. CF108]
MNAFSNKNNPTSKHSAQSRDKGEESFFGVQAKLNIGKSNDKYEIEADSTADRVLSKKENKNNDTFFSPAAIQKKQNNSIQKKEESENEIQEKPLSESITPIVQLRPDNEGIVQQKVQSNTSKTSSNIEQKLKSSKGNGSTLSEDTKTEMESGFGTDFGAVRIHNDSNSVQMNKQLGAQAFAHENDIYFNEGKYNPDSKDGKHLLAHELTHTIQQGANKPSIQKTEEEHPKQVDKDQTAISENQNPSANEEGAKKRDEAKNTMDEELSEVSTEPNVAVERTEGEPTVLKPKEFPAQDAVEPQPEETESETEPGFEQEAEPLVEEPNVEENVEEQASQILGTETQTEVPKNGNKQQAQTNPIAVNENSSFGEEDSATTSTETEANETIINQIPDRELTEAEFMAELESGSPAEKVSVAQGMLSELRNYGEQEKQAVLSNAESLIGEIMTNTESTIAAINMEILAKTSQIESIFSSKTAQLSAYAAQLKATVASLVEQEKLKVDADTLVNIQDLEATLEQRKQEITSYTDSESQQPQTIVDSEIQRASSELEAAASQAEAEGEMVAGRYLGNEDPAPEQRQVARQVGRESAADIRDKIPGIREELNNKAEEYKNRYQGFAVKIHEKIDEVKPQLITPINEIAASTKTTLDTQKETTIQAIDQRLASDTQALETAKSASISQIQSQGEETTSEIQGIAEQTINEINENKQEIITSIDDIVTETETIISAEEAPYLDAIREIIDSSRANIQLTSANGLEQLQTFTSESSSLMTETQLQFSTATDQTLQSGTQQADELVNKAIASIDKTAGKRQTDAQTAIANLTTQQQEIITNGLTQIDAGIEQSKEELRAVTTEFRGVAKEATDQSIVDAKKPLTDQTSTRADAAARDLEGSWLDGIISAIGELLVGFLILVAIALVVAILAGITLGAALLIVGAVFLVISVIAAYSYRSAQFQAMGRDAGFGETLLYALSDATGITGIVEAYTGVEYVTGNTLNKTERGRRGTIGFVTLAGIIMGARAGIKAFRAPPGTFLRPTSIFNGWRAFSFIENVKGVWGDIVAIGTTIRNAGTRIYEAFRQAEGFVDFVRRLFRPTPEETPANPLRGRRPAMPEQPVIDENGNLTEYGRWYYERPGNFRNRQNLRNSVWENAVEEGNGTVRDPVSGEEISPDNWILEERPGQDLATLQRNAAQRGAGRNEFLNDYNNPRNYRPRQRVTTAEFSGERPATPQQPVIDSATGELTDYGRWYYERPSGFRTGVRDTTWSNAEAGSIDGVVRDPLTGRTMLPEEPWDMGHRYGFEFWKHRVSAAQRGIGRTQFIDEYNNPNHYRPELPSSNQGHQGEAPPGIYYGD